MEKDCYKKYNLCQQLKKKEVNKKILKAVETMANIIELDTVDLYRDSIHILAQLKSFNQLVPAPDASPVL